METLFIYIIKVNIALTVFYLLYMLLFRKDTFIRLRRYYFLSAIIFSLSYPLFTVSALSSLIDLTPEPAATQTSVYIGEISTGEWIVDDIEEVETPIDWTIIANNILLVGTLFLSLRLLWQLLSIVSIKSRSEKRSLFGYLFYHLKEEITPFSFFNWIFVNSESHNEKELKQILLHEHTHARQWHSFDILLIEMLRIAFWWNPIVWFMKRDIAINLEYLADEAVLKKGVETTEYQYHLLQLTNHETAVQIVNNFNVSQLKQRIIMMNTNKSPMRNLAKYLSVLPLALLLITANSLYAQQNENISDKNYKAGKMLPEFPGGPESLTKFFNDNITYPNEAKEKGIKGRVVSSFIVRKDGSIARSQIVQSVAPSLDKETLRVINAMPKWIPYKEESDIVGIEYTLRFTFDLNDNKVASWVKIIGVDILGKEEKNEIVVRGYDSMKDEKPKELSLRFGTEEDPLVIIDDVKMSKGSDLNDLNPDDIKSISVLKAESAMSMYGEEGKDGVIIVTLKDKAKIPTTTGKAVDSERKTEEEEIFVVVEDQPQFPGGTEALMQYLGNNIKYPKEANEKKIEGRVIVNFVINEDGSISDASIVRGVHPLLDAEAIRVISAMPNWKPGKQRGKAVNVKFTLPITFRLEGDKELESEAMQKLKDKGPVTVVDMKNDDPGKAFHEFIGKTIKYPVIAQENGIMGVVRAVYDVNEKGEISNVRITESVDSSLSAELERVTKLMPKDIALLRSGGKAASDVDISANFRLQNGNRSTDKQVETDVVVVGYGKPVDEN